MKITPIQLAKRVEQWGKTLAPLGVAHFEIQCVTLTDDVPGADTAKAAVQCSTHYDECWFYFSNQWLEGADETAIDQTIIHEWLHVAFRDLDFTNDSVEPWMPERTYETWRDTVNHEQEGLIERLAISLYQAYKGLPPRFKP